MVRFTKLAALAGAAALALAACTSSPDSAQTDSDGTGVGSTRELRAGITTDVPTWVTADAMWGPPALYYQAVYDTIVRTGADGSIEPGLAESWEYDDELTELTLEVRDGVTFSDGAELTAQVVADNLQRFREGASADRGRLAAVTDVEAPDDDTVVLTLSQPDPALLTYLSQAPGLVASPETFDAPDAQTTPVGSGPYILDSAATTPGSAYRFEANPDYWDPDSQHYDALVLNVYADASAMLNAIRDGQLDYANLHDSSQVGPAEDAGYTVHSHALNWSGLILADRSGTVNEPLGDVRVRQAINYAIDREGLNQALADGFGEPTSQIFGAATEAFDPELDEYYPHDPERARELLEEAGFPDGVTIPMPQTPYVPAAQYELIAGMLAEAGVNVEHEPTGEDFIGDILGGKWPAVFFGLTQDPTAWMTYLNAAAPESTWNFFHEEDETVAALANRMRLGGEDATAAAQELNRYLVEQGWFAPFFREKSFKVTNSGTELTLRDGETTILRNIRPAS